LRASAGRELRPEIVDLLLRLARDLEGNRLIELELRAAVKRDEFLPLEPEGDHHHRARLLAVDLLTGIDVAADLVDLRVLEDRAIELRRVLGFGVEPQAGRDLLLGDGHWRAPRRLGVTRPRPRSRNVMAWRPRICRDSAPRPWSREVHPRRGLWE